MDNPVLSFRANFVDPVLEKLRDIDERRIAREIERVFKANENSFFTNRIVNAIRTINADFREQFDKMMKDQLRKHAPTYEIPDRANYYDVVQKAIRSKGVTGPDLDEATQAFFAELFTKGARPGREQSIFKLFDPDREKDFAKFLFNRARLRALDLLKRHQKEKTRDVSLSPGKDDEDGPAIDPRADIEDLDEQVEYKMMLQKVDKHLERMTKHWPELRLNELWHHLLDGRTKSEVAREMGLKPPNITHRMKELKQELQALAKRNGWDDFLRLLEQVK